MDREKVIKGLEAHGCGKSMWRICNNCPYDKEECIKDRCRDNLLYDAYALLKEQEMVVKQWTKEIADNQLAHAPNDSHEFMSLDEHLENEYKRGIWDGLQIAWNIISEGR